MTTWKELNEQWNKIDWSHLNNTSNEEFNAAICNEIAHEVIALREKNIIMELILSAAKSGCFSTIIPDCHIDTRNWLEDLGFNVYYSSAYHVE